VGRAVFIAEDAVIGEKAAAGDAELGVGLGGEGAGDELHRGPDAAGVLPAATGAAEPFTEDGAGGDEAALGFFQRAGEALGLTGGAHADGDEGAKKIR